MNLNELSQLSSEIEAQLIQSEGEITPDIENILAQVERDFPAKIDSYSYTIDKLKWAGEFWKSKAKIFQKLSRASDKTVDAIKDRIKEVMVHFDKREMRGNDTKFQLRPLAPKIEIVDESLIPIEWKMEEINLVPDMDRIRSAMIDGIVIPGVEIKENFALYMFDGISKQASNESRDRITK